MTSYITLGEGKNTKVVVTTTGGSGTTVTTCDADIAGDIAAALSSISKDLGALLCRTALNPDAGTDADGFDTARHLLNLYDAASEQRGDAPIGPWAAPADLLSGLASAVRDAPKAVQTAVRKYLQQQLTPLHEPLVPAVASDYRHEVAVLLNPILSAVGADRACALLMGLSAAEADGDLLYDEPVLQSRKLPALITPLSHLSDLGRSIESLLDVNSVQVHAPSAIRWARRNAPNAVQAMNSELESAALLAAPTKELRADCLQVGDRYREYGMGEEFHHITQIDWHGDTMLITAADDDETAIDRDDSVEIVDRTWLRTAGLLQPVAT